MEMWISVTVIARIISLVLGVIAWNKVQIFIGNSFPLILAIISNLLEISWFSLRLSWLQFPSLCFSYIETEILCWSDFKNVELNIFIHHKHFVGLSVWQRAQSGGRIFWISFVWPRIRQSHASVVFAL